MKRGKILSAAASLIAATVFAVGAPLGASRAKAEQIANTQKHVSNLSISPAVITEVKNEAHLDEMLAAPFAPSTLIYRVNDELQIVDGEDSYAFADMFAKMRKKTVAVVDLASTVQADKLKEFITTKKVEDISVMSKDISVLTYARNLMPRVRGVADFSERELGNSLADEVEESHKAGANVVVLNAEQSTRETVSYLQSVVTTVWTYGGKIETAYDVAKLVSTETYGIITDNYGLCYSAYSLYEKNSIGRSFYNIAHRGLPHTEAENSLEGFVAAVEAGATHIEIDVKVTADNELVIMHDNELSRTTNGSGNIESMTTAQLRDVKITKTYDGNDVTPVNIPTLDEVFDFLETNDARLFLEIKTEKDNFCSLLKSKLETRDKLRGRIAVITFSTKQLKNMRAILPELPLVSLNAVAYDDMGNGSLGDLAQNNMVFSSAFDYDTLANRNLKSRGYMAFSWTFDTKVAVAGVAVKGCLGITNNAADQVGKFTRAIEAKSGAEIDRSSDYKGKNVTVEAVSYNGERNTVTGKIAFYEETADGINAIISYNDGNYTAYSSPVRLSIREETPAESNESVESGENESSSGGNRSDSGESGGSVESGSENSGAASGGSNGGSTSGGGCGGGVNGAGLFGLIAALAVAGIICGKKLRG